MKSIFLLLLAAFYTITIGCNKQRPIDNNLYGKWKLEEIRDDYGNGRLSGWRSISGEIFQEFEFYENGEYHETNVLSDTLFQCSGIYQFVSPNKINLTSSCNAHGENLALNQITTDVLIINRLGTEGMIYYRYHRMK